MGVHGHFATLNKGWTPANIVGTLALWIPYQGSINSGTNYSQITDLSGHGNHLVQAVGAAQPARTAALKNGRDGMTSVAGSGRFIAAAGLSFSGSFACVIVVRASTVSYLWHHAGGATYLYPSINNSSSIARVGTSGINRAVNWGSDNVWRVITTHCSATDASHNMHINGVEQIVTPGTSSADPNGGPVAGAWAPLSTSDGVTQTTGDFLAGWLGTPNPSASDIARAEAYFGDLFAIP